MLSGKAFQSARAAYHCLNILSKQEILDKTTKDNHTPLTENLVDLSLDHNKGLPQQKTAILKHITNHKFDSNSFYIITIPFITILILNFDLLGNLMLKPMFEFLTKCQLYTSIPLNMIVILNLF
jgi:hypothetical protein